MIGGGGRGGLEYVTLADRDNDTVQDVAADALFVMIGGSAARPHTKWLPDEIARDPLGYVVTGRDLLALPAVRWTYHREPMALETSLPGVFAAGDVRARLNETNRFGRRRGRGHRPHGARSSERGSGGAQLMRPSRLQV